MKNGMPIDRSWAICLDLLRNPVNLINLASSRNIFIILLILTLGNRIRLRYNDLRGFSEVTLHGRVTIVALRATVKASC